MVLSRHHQAGQQAVVLDERVRPGSQDRPPPRTVNLSLFGRLRDQLTSFLARHVVGELLDAGHGVSRPGSWVTIRRMPGQQLPLLPGHRC
jgi:hypothetical protein